MAIREIVKYGDPRLLAPNEPVKEFDAELRRLVADMFETMYLAPGVGLAAPQIGINLRLAVIDVDHPSKGNRIVMANPAIVKTEGEQREEEGCLSLPSLGDVVPRPERTTARAQDLEGNWYEITGTGLLARALCHETDHLDQTLFFMRMGRIRKELLMRKAKKKVAEGW